MASRQDQGFLSALNDLKGVLQAANNLIPGIVVIAIAVASLIISIALLSAKLMVGIAILLVLFVAIIVYVRTANYGEAALSLVAGLLTVFSVEWTASRFIVFSAVWVAFSLFALMITGIKLVAKLESIYKHAAVSMTNNAAQVNKLEKQLRDIGNKRTPYGQLQAVQRAEAVRLLVFRKTPVDALPDALIAIETFTTLTGVDAKTITLFVADLIKVIQFGQEHQKSLDKILATVRESAVPPEDFIKAFQCSRRLVLSDIMSPEAYFQALRENLEDGVDPEDMLEVIKSKHS